VTADQFSVEPVFRLYVIMEICTLVLFCLSFGAINRNDLKGLLLFSSLLLLGRFIVVAVVFIVLLQY
jgi:hypothetical protein